MKIMVWILMVVAVMAVLTTTPPLRTRSVATAPTSSRAPG